MATRPRKRRRAKQTALQKATKRAKIMRDLKFRANVAELKARIAKAGA